MEGTYHVYEAAREHGIGKVLLCSTMGVYGESVRTPKNGVAVVTEELATLPRDVYGLTKTLSEEVASFYARTHGIRTIAYRLGMFVPEDFLRYGFRLLRGGVDDRDVAQAFLLGRTTRFPMVRSTSWRRCPSARSNGPAGAKIPPLSWNPSSLASPSS